VLSQSILTIATANKVSSFFTPVSQKPKVVEKISWQIVHGTLLVAQYNASKDFESVRKRRKIAAFDFVRGTSLFIQLNPYPGRTLP